MLIVLAFINIYPAYMAQELVFQSKQSSMQNQAALISASLSPLESLASETVRQVMELLDDSSLTRIIIADTSCAVIYDSDYDADSLGKYALFSEIVTALGGKDVFRSEFSETAFISTAAAPIMYRSLSIGAVYVYEYDAGQAEFIMDLQGNMSILSLIICVVAVMFGVLFAGSITRRIDTVLQAMQQVREGQYEHHVPIVGTDEIAELGKEFNTLMDRLRTTEEVRQRFVSDASHELKTPLAAIRLLSDSVVQNEDMDRDTMREFIEDIGGEAGRLARTTEKLLSLTRIDSSSNVEYSCINVAEVASETQRLLKPLAEQRDVKLEFSLSGGCFVKATQDDVYQIIFNLVENGIKYNVPGGMVMVLLYRREGEVRLIVDDTGIGIPKEDLPNVFERFYRIDRARTQQAGGSGLGLSIVHATASRFGGSVTAEPREGGGMRFAVIFPACEPDE